MEKTFGKAFRLIAFTLFIFWSWKSVAQEMLELRISGIKNDNGKVMILVQSAKGDTVMLRVVEAEKNEITVKLSLPYDKYAISTYHDENENQKIDKSFLGYPVERYGFSNNAREPFGPPSLKDRIFHFSGDSTIHRIKIE